MTSKSRPMVKCTCAGQTVPNQFVVYSLMISVLRVGSIPASIIGSLHNHSPTILPVLLPHPRTQLQKRKLPNPWTLHLLLALFLSRLEVLLELSLSCCGFYNERHTRNTSMRSAIFIFICIFIWGLLCPKEGNATSLFSSPPY